MPIPNQGKPTYHAMQSPDDAAAVWQRPGGWLPWGGTTRYPQGASRASSEAYDPEVGPIPTTGPRGGLVMDRVTVDLKNRYGIKTYRRFSTFRKRQHTRSTPLTA